MVGGQGNRYTERSPADLTSAEVCKINGRCATACLQVTLGILTVHYRIRTVVRCLPDIFTYIQVYIQRRTYLTRRGTASKAHKNHSEYGVLHIRLA